MKKGRPLSLFINFLVLSIGLFVYTGWNPTQTLGSFDLLSGHSILMQSYINNGGHINSMYDFNMLGGAVVGTTGVLPIQELLLLFLNDSLLIASLTVFFILYLNSLLLMLLIEETYFYLNKENLQLNRFSEVLVLLGLNFLPVCAWRINHGHINILNGIIAFCLVLIIPLLIKRAKSSSYHFTLIFMGLIHLIPYSSYQMITYALIFFSPFYVTWIISSLKKKNLETISLICLTTLFAIFATFPQLFHSLTHLISNNSERGIGSVAIFTYIKPELSFLWSSIGIGLNQIPKHLSSFLHHEINYPVPIIVILTCALYLKKITLKKILYILPLGLIVVFAVNIFDFAHSLSQNIPLLASFRVPYRGLIFVNLALNILAMCYLLKNTRLKSMDFKFFGLVIVALSLLTLLDSKNLEYTSLIILSLGLLAVYYQKIDKEILKIITLTFVLALNLKGFNERFKDSVHIGQTKKILQEIDSDKFKAPPLSKSIVLGGYDKFSSNLLFLNNVSIINSYWHPITSFNKFYSQMHELDYIKTRLVFNLNHQHPQFQKLETLFAIKNKIYISQRPGKVLLSYQENMDLKNIWSSSHFTSFGSSKDLVDHIKNLNSNNISALYTHILYESDAPIPKEFHNQCEFFGLTKKDSVYLVSAKSSKDCTIVLPINHSSWINIKTDNPQKKLVESRRVYGVITALLIPKGEHLITLSGKSPFTWTKILQVLGYLFFLLMMLIISKHGPILK